MMATPEQALIGAMVIMPECASVVFGTLDTADFEDKELADIYAAMRDSYQQYNRLDATLLPKTLNWTLIQECDATCPAPSAWQQYAQAVKDSAIIRRAQNIGLQIANSNTTKDDLLELVQQLNDTVTDSKQSAHDFRMTKALCDWMQTQQSKPDYILTGLPRLDRALKLSKGDFAIIGARPSAGKTALALQMAHTMATAGRRVAFFSLETSPIKLTDRLVACVGGYPLTDVIQHSIQQDSRFAQMMDKLSRLPLSLIPASGKPIGWVNAVAAQLKADVILLDYLQLVKPSGSAKTRFEQVTQISMDLHNMAQQSNRLVIALSQLNRAGDDNSLPSIRELRESGQLEQDADAILLLHNPLDGPYRVKLAKNKTGRCGTFELNYNKQIQRFYEPEETDIFE